MDLRVCREALQQCREEVENLPEDLFLQLPESHDAFHQAVAQKAPRYPLIERCLSEVQLMDFVGLLAEKEFEVLGTGLYVADVHYLNWSDVQEGRITGMTRFGCFWVENGQIVGPVKDMRFDESLYHFWGRGLEGFSNKSETFPKTSTYFQRDMGTIKTPGMLVNDFTFVL